MDSTSTLTSRASATAGVNVSRPFVVKLLDDGQVPFRKVGNRRRMRLADVLAYRRRDDEHRDLVLPAHRGSRGAWPLRVGAAFRRILLTRMLEPMASRADDISNDPVLVVIDDDDPSLTFDDWLALLAADEPTNVDAEAAET